MEKCVGCQFYDRQATRTTDSRGVQWGQCRRGAPMLHPINVKSYMIEGVWPHVRDDDWCGEWKVALRRVDNRTADAASAPTLMAGAAAGSSFAARSAAATPMPGAGGAFARPTASGPLMTSSGRGD